MHKHKFFIGLALGLALGAAGGMTLQKNSRSIRAKLWRLKLRAEIDRKLFRLKKFTREGYDRLIEDALEAYRDHAVISDAAFALLETELKREWKEAKRRFETLESEAAEAVKEKESEEDEDDE